MLVVFIVLTNAVFAQDEPDIRVELIRDENYPNLEIVFSHDHAETPIKLNGTDILVRTDGQEIPIQSFETQLAELGVVFIFDSSESMIGSPLDNVRQSSLRFVESILPNDEVAIVEFDTTARQILTFTTDINEARIAINSMFADGQTALFDAAAGGIDVAARSQKPRRAVIIVTDGNEFGNLSSPGARRRAIDNAILNNVTIYAIGIGQSVDESFLRQLVDVSGGIYVGVSSPDDISSAYDVIAQRINILRTRYVVTIESQATLLTSEIDIDVSIGNETFFLTYSPDQERLIASNEDWTPVYAVFNGYPMVLVPPGCFEMGSLITERDEIPAVERCIFDFFWMGQYEVTNALFGSSGHFSGPNQPRESINWIEARAFCESIEMRLPSEMEWEYTARGPSSWLYPWGGIPDPERAIYYNLEQSTTIDVGQTPGFSWAGAADMAGNVAEWTQSTYSPYPYNAEDGRETQELMQQARVIRGGGYLNMAHEIHASNRYALAPTIASTMVGFRCTRSFSQDDVDLIPEGLR